jgi:RNA-directed DNA polymerase
MMENCFLPIAEHRKGGAISPLSANIALHGLETIVSNHFPTRPGFTPPKVVRDADDFVFLHEKREVIDQSREIITEWLKGMGLEL